MTRKEFEKLYSGQVIYDSIHKNADGTPRRWKVSGSMQGSLKTGSAKWPLKHGIYTFGYLTLNNLDALRTEESYGKNE